MILLINLHTFKNFYFNGKGCLNYSIFLLIGELLFLISEDINTYVTKFQWEAAKYPVKQSLKVLSEIIGKQVTQIDNDLKTKATAYNNLKNSLASIDRKAA